MAGDVIEMRPDVSQKFFSGREILRKRDLDGLGESTENLVEHCAVNRFFVLEVVIKQSLVYASRAGNSIGTRAGNPFPGKLGHSSLQNSGAAFFGVAAGSETRFDCNRFHLINQLVRL